MKIEPGHTLESTAVNKELDDLGLADEALKKADAAQLHTILKRVVAERTELAKALDALISGWSLMKGETPEIAPEVMFAMERVATEAITFAREVVQALMQHRISPAAIGPVRSHAKAKS